MLGPQGLGQVGLDQPFLTTLDTSKVELSKRVDPVSPGPSLVGQGIFYGLGQAIPSFGRAGKCLTQPNPTLEGPRAGAS